MNRYTPSLFCLLGLLLAGCGGTTAQSVTDTSYSGGDTSDPDYFKPIDLEIEKSYNYFMKATNRSADTNGYGLSQDRLSNRAMASIAATGFALASYPVFVEQGLMSKDEAKTLASGTMDTILRMQADSSVSYAGCISHFVSRSAGARLQDSEISTIDTAILVSGAITASQYFGGELIEKANSIWGNVDYTKFQISQNGKSYISMGVNQPGEGRKQLGAWDYYAEQLMIYILGVGNPNPEHRISDLYYKSFTKHLGSYHNYEFIHSWFGSLFTYQFSHAFFDFSAYVDYRGVDYFNNSVLASRAAYQYCQDMSGTYKTFSDSSWGLTACDTPMGYSGLLGNPPRGYGPNSDYLAIEGTVAPTAAIGSMPFTPVESYRALKHYQSIPQLNDPEYGLYDAYNLDFRGTEWYCNDIIGIDKGIEVLQLYNYKNPNFVSSLAMKNPNVIQGFTGNGFTEVENGIQG